MTALTPQQNDGSYFDSLVPRVTRADLEREMAKVVIPPKTPQQMRELADKQDRITAGLERAGVGATHERAMSAALRTAADQLEAVRALSFDLDKEQGQHEVFAFLVASDIRDILDGHPERVTWTEKPAFLTVDTAPQGDCDE